MNIKSIIAGLIFTTSLFAVGASQAACAYCNVHEGFSGIGWNTVSCRTCVQPALTWQQYVSGGYMPPVVGQSR
jgi:hypothetical protein